ncbi:MAG: hypothetical protein NTW16_00960 [Bacteroidetes bacterium]|nr:hypothetical protein [Bacteroidota bacterium]
METNEKLPQQDKPFSKAQRMPEAQAGMKEKISKPAKLSDPPFGQGYIRECGMIVTEDRVGKAFVISCPKPKEESKNVK